MVRYALNINLNQVASGGDLEEIVDKLIKYFEASNELEKLIDGALKQNQNNVQLKAVKKEFEITTSLVKILIPVEKKLINQMQRAYRYCCPDWRKSKIPETFYEILANLDERHQQNDDEKLIVKFVDFLLENLLVNRNISNSKAEQLKQWLSKNAKNVYDLESHQQNINSQPDIIVNPNSSKESLNPAKPKGSNQFSRADFLKGCLTTMPILFLVYYFTNKQTGLKKFPFTVVTVNRRGETIKEESKQADYFTQDLGNGVDLDMVSIPEGSFLMGSPETEKGTHDRERPQHKVTIQPFFLGKYLVTQAQWRAVAKLPKVNRDLNPDPSYFPGDNRPVEQVNWYDAMEFCDRLSQYTGRKYRLPSEAEWEYACRAGTTTPFHYKDTTPFHYGETITGLLANYNASYTYAEEKEGEYREETTPVGHFPPNGFGLYDMHGNLWEWCADPRHDNYKGAPTDGRIWTKSSNHTKYILRGGSWSASPIYCRSAHRDYNFTRDLIKGNVGFRVARGVG
ncbi:MAG: formylglycine-generating enzyme family protein [Moorea sp. SIO2I5]|nr:formylglycine-generating enzyme family protein [Moorena sp. SIO2I5]